MAEKRLGRGLEFLISDSVGEAEALLNLQIEDLHPNPFQPRMEIDEDAEKELAESIKLHGILQPIVVRKAKAGYEIVAGERRWRASKRIGLKEVPCVLRKAGDDQMLELALIENIQRKDLDPVEKAKGFKEMIGRASITQEEVALRIGISRAAVANFLRLLDLPKEILDSVSRGTISFGHAKAIMALEDAEDQRRMMHRILSAGLSVRESEKEARKSASKKKARRTSRHAQITELERNLMEKLGTKVVIKTSGKKGKIIIEFYSNEDFERIAEMIG
jgi:ParB family chromosome partitioning protein